MARSKSRFIGPRLRRLRRDLGRTQSEMAEDLGISASYVALIERNQRPLTADLLLRLAETFDVDLKTFAGDGGEEMTARLHDAFRDPLLADLDVTPGDQADLAAGNPAMAEAMLRLFTAYREGQLALADRKAEGSENPVDDARAFLSARRNYFPVLDERAERLARAASEAGGLAGYLASAYGIKVRSLPGDVMGQALRRLDPHRGELALSDTLDVATRSFQVALTLAYRDLDAPIEAALDEGQMRAEAARRLARRALANYGAAAILMPYTEMFRHAEKSGYDVEALARHFGVSFEQAAHRLTTLRKPGAEGVPFFFIRVDKAGNVSKRLDGGGFPFARHAGSCPLWSLHDSFRTPREVRTEVLELPEGERFFSIARTVTAGGGAYGATKVTRAVALCCPIEDAGRLVYASEKDLSALPATPIGVTCRLCQRAGCAARAEPPIGRSLLPDDYRRLVAPFAFADR
ncbi:putative transcriptional regulator [Parvularcula bermudensis HTCC2503]|uniref:Putative transcriptional regulator n=1 Tax=Parvularcula bermudensis (strain ATCC BAA-594 / HTCC2503 / KCTC 12087) TaxID=314260 RepID=E0TFN9_PARBH|nr:helix-turn-helix transcriptional regulator [Parvularcula bermudensis]ADM09054.1 putative transcriptional regulator [Parvularcula bermudensis HTCC2503]